jgi:hypothetical protein
MYVMLWDTHLGRPESIGPYKLSRRFEFSHIPVGNHQLRVIGFHFGDTVKVETVEKYVSVFPRLGATDINIRFSTLKFGGK